jgi:HD-GYP domain-containing protein (c-di-GMP phosphodiesterase class II)
MFASEIRRKTYYIVDKIIIDNDHILNFNLYHKGKNKKLELVYQKGTLLSKSSTKSLIALDALYVLEKEKLLYEKYHKEFMHKKVASNKMYSIYEDVSKCLTKLFENPESLGHIQSARDKVAKMVATILEDNFTISSFLSILAYDYYTHTHSLNVSVYAICLGKHLGMSERELEELGTSALLHDIGKSKIDSKIINKNGRLTAKEFKLVQEHSWLGWDILAKVGIENKKILLGVRNHHEKIDGTGYPDNLKGDEISQFAKIIAVCDVFDALTTKRSYKDSVGTFNTLAMMKKEMQNHLDHNLINQFILMFRQEDDIN